MTIVPRIGSLVQEMNCTGHDPCSYGQRYRAAQALASGDHAGQRPDTTPVVLAILDWLIQ
jgi:hypothetical protein